LCHFVSPVFVSGEASGKCVYEYETDFLPRQFVNDREDKAFEVLVMQERNRAIQIKNIPL
jgi:hypothetical protein